MQQDGKQIDDVWVQTGLQQPLVLTRTEKKLVRSEEHTSELQSQSNLVCRLLLEKKNLQVREERGIERPNLYPRDTTSTDRQSTHQKTWVRSRTVLPPLSKPPVIS